MGSEMCIRDRDTAALTPSSASKSFSTHQKQPPAKTAVAALAKDVKNNVLLSKKLMMVIFIYFALEGVYGEV